jgi:hypothetical protein
VGRKLKSNRDKGGVTWIFGNSSRCLFSDKKGERERVITLHDAIARLCKAVGDWEELRSEEKIGS